MIIIRSIKQMSEAAQKARLKRQSIGFVPTMGALHEGHLSLIRQARKENKIVVVSIFVNPAQFSPKEDLKKYPRVFKQDVSLCRKECVDIIFYPDSKEMYPDNYKTYVTVEGLSDLLCGKFRPGHFRGVATVVIKLFNIIQPDISYFGQKDAQQSIIVKKMVYDLNMPIEIKVLPTIREEGGLAMSSRNVYLNRWERLDALVLTQSLALAQDLIRGGLKDTGLVINRMRHFIQKKKSVRIDYISLIDPQNLKPVKKISGACLLALAVYIGQTRLIDNMIING